MSQKLLPEWAPVRAVLIAWPFPSGAWSDNYEQVLACYWQLLSAITEVVPAWVLFHRDLDQDDFKQALDSRGISAAQVKLIRDVPYDDTWIRDYGPLSTTHGYVSLTFNGWGGKYEAHRDNAVPACLSAVLGAAPVKSSFVGEGGALETNGEVLLVNANCVVDELRNPGLDQRAVEKRLISELGLKKVIWLKNAVLSGDDTDGHIDTIARFADARTVVFAGRNEKHIDARVLADLHSQIEALAKQHQWRTLELPSPSYSSLIDGRPLPCTYANFLIVNGSVLAPVYGLPEDAMALAVLKKAFPNHCVVAVRCEALLEQHGSLHCATMQIAQLPSPISG